MAIRIGGVINTGCCSFRSRNVRNSASRIARLPPRRCRRRRVRLSIMVSVSSRISYTRLTRKFFAKAKQKYIFYLFFCDNKSLFLCTIGTFLGYTTFTKEIFAQYFVQFRESRRFLLEDLLYDVLQGDHPDGLVEGIPVGQWPWPS